MDKIKLLLVEDEVDFAYVIKSALEMTGRYDVCLAFDGREGLEYYRSFQPEVIVTDIKMGDMDGREMVRIIREKDPYTHIIFVTSCKKDEEVRDGLKIGADAYLIKPILIDTLDAQVCNLLKRATSKLWPVGGDNDYVIGSFRFSAKNRYLIRNGERTDLPPIEAKILKLLVVHKGQVVDRETEEKLIVTKNNYVDSRTMDVHIYELRKKLSADPSVEIVTVRGEGHMLKDGFS